MSSRWLINLPGFSIFAFRALVKQMADAIISKRAAKITQAKTPALNLNPTLETKSEGKSLIKKQLIADDNSNSELMPETETKSEIESLIKIKQLDVLIADDDPVIRSLKLGQALIVFSQVDDLRVVLVDNAQSAIAELRETRREGIPLIVFLDREFYLEPPTTDGFSSKRRKSDAAEKVVLTEVKSLREEGCQIVVVSISNCYEAVCGKDRQEGEPILEGIDLTTVKRKSLTAHPGVRSLIQEKLQSAPPKRSQSMFDLRFSPPKEKSLTRTCSDPSDVQTDLATFIIVRHQQDKMDELRKKLGKAFSKARELHFIVVDNKSHAKKLFLELKQVNHGLIFIVDAVWPEKSNKADNACSCKVFSDPNDLGTSTTISQSMAGKEIRQILTIDCQPYPSPSPSLRCST